VIVAIFVPVLRQVDSTQPAQPFVDVRTVLARNPDVCGVEGTPVSAQLWSGGYPEIFKIQCQDGTTVYDSEP
jgi:hypothetical protein